MPPTVPPPIPHPHTDEPATTVLAIAPPDPRSAPPDGMRRAASNGAQRAASDGAQRSAAVLAARFPVDDAGRVPVPRRSPHPLSGAVGRLSPRWTRLVDLLRGRRAPGRHRVEGLPVVGWSMFSPTGRPVRGSRRPR